MRLHLAILTLLLLPTGSALAQAPEEPQAKPLPSHDPLAEPTPAGTPEARPEPEQPSAEAQPDQAQPDQAPNAEAQPDQAPNAEAQPDQAPNAEAQAEAEAEAATEGEAPKAEAIGEAPEPAPIPPPAVDGDQGAQETKAATPKKSPLVKPSPRQGHFIALGLHGVGAYANDRDRGGRGPGFGAGYSLRLGERVTSWLDLGIAFAYASVGGDDPWAFGRLTVHSQFYPSEHYFVHGGFGFGAAGGGDPEDPGFSRGRFGDVYTAGVGRNIYLTDESKSGGWIVTPVLTAEYGRDDQFPNAALWLGVEIGRWWGIGRNQLDLGFDEAYK